MVSLNSFMVVALLSTPDVAGDVFTAVINPRKLRRCSSEPFLKPKLSLFEVISSTLRNFTSYRRPRSESYPQQCAVTPPKLQKLNVAMQRNRTKVLSNTVPCTALDRRNVLLITTCEEDELQETRLVLERRLENWRALPEGFMCVGEDKSYMFMLEDVERQWKRRSDMMKTLLWRQQRQAGATQASLF